MAVDEAIVSPRRNSGLLTRVISAVVMLGILATAFLLGGVWLDTLIILVGLVCFWEFARLILRATKGAIVRTLSLVLGALYIGAATYALTIIDSYYFFAAIGTVIFCDVFAYFAGKTIGGPKLIPAISPNKTWAGLLGGMTGAGLWLMMVVAAFYWIGGNNNWTDLIAAAWDDASNAFILGAVLAVIAQAGDFFQSWLKRKAGVKDSANLIPGHGGVFDRVDGLLPIALIVGALSFTGF